MELPLPKVDKLEYLLDILFDLGICEQDQGGLKPLSFQEIKAYLNLLKINLNADDIRLLRKLSKAYVTQYHDSKEAIPAPYSESNKHQASLLFANHPRYRS